MKSYEMTDKDIEKAIEHHAKAGGGDPCYSGNIYPMRTVSKAAQRKLLKYVVKIACPSSVRSWDEWNVLLKDLGVNP